MRMRTILFQISIIISLLRHIVDVQPPGLTPLSEVNETPAGVVNFWQFLVLREKRGQTNTRLKIVK